MREVHLRLSLSLFNEGGSSEVILSLFNEEGVRQGCLLSPTLFDIFLARIMCEALDDHDGSVSIGGRLITNFRFADGIVVNPGERRSWRPVRPSRYNHHKVQNEERSRQDERDDKQPKWLPKRDQDKISEARRSGELQVPWSNHLQRRIKIRDSFQYSPDNSSSF